MNVASPEPSLHRILDQHGVVGERFRRELVHDLKAKVLFRGARDAVEVSGPAGSGRKTVASVVEAAASEVLGRSVDVTIVDAGAEPVPGSARIRVKPLHEREDDLWEMIAHFFDALAKEHDLQGCGGFSRQATADIAEVVRETGLESVRSLRDLVRDLVFEALAEGPLPHKITSELCRPHLEAVFGQTATRRAERDVAVLESAFAALPSRSLLEELASVHGVAPEVLERQAAVIRDVVASIDDVPRSYRNIMDRTEDVLRASLWLLTGAETQAAFRRHFGGERFMRPTKSVAWAFYNRVFKRDM